MKKPYLIQRATILRPLANKNARLSKAVNFDYMGSAEFEFEALPSSFRAIQAVADDWKQHLVPEICEQDKMLRVYSAFTEAELQEYTQHLLKLRAGHLRTKEATRFEVNYGATFKYTEPSDFWWDIENHVMFGFDKAFMNRLVH